MINHQWAGVASLSVLRDYARVENVEILQAQNMTPRERLLAALRCQPVDRTPVWIMRQAGRYLPEYRALKEKHSFVEMVRTPELACEVTLQPLKRFDLDAAIVFSDILVIPEAMGQPYSFPEGGGIQMDFPIRSNEDVQKLSTTYITDRLQYVADALTLVRKEMGDDRALLGFGGSPWTLAHYMVHGQSSPDFLEFKKLLHGEFFIFERLMDKLTDALIQYFRMQIEAGVDAIQIFDSWGATCQGHNYERFSLSWIRKIIEELPAGFPIIVYAKGMAHHAAEIVRTRARCLAVDWTVDMASLRRFLPREVSIQGNLDPSLMSASPEAAAAGARAIMERMRGVRGHVFNLGHGILPSANPECVAAVVETVHAAR